MKVNRFIERGNLKHNGFYDYSLVIEAQIREKFKIICPIHGVFEQRGDAHLSGQGCGKCKKSILKSQNEFVIDAKIKHENYYDYTLVNYVNSKLCVDIICPVHGVFKQTPDNHLAGHGCAKCAFVLNSSIMKNVSADKFENEANETHNDKYDYQNSIYTRAKDKINISCKIHGEFKQTPNDHLSGKGCPKCGVNLSIGENEVRDFIENELGFKTDKIRIESKEIDIFIPEKNVGIEYDGLYWHSDNFRDKKYHLNKTLLCEEHNIQLLHIFEDEWINKKEIVKSIIRSKLGVVNNKIFARKCIVKELKVTDVTKFLFVNHLQGNVGGCARYGLYYNDELVSLMTFGKKRASMGVKIRIDDEYEMMRFCNKLNATVVGGASKLLKHFIIEHNPASILTFADRRYSNGNLYLELGFKHVGYSDPNYFYFSKNSLKREYRFKYRKDILIKQGFDALKTEHQIMQERGYYKIFDCGHIKFIMRF